jgi:hypothetical protein
MDNSQTLPRAGAAPESGELENGRVWLNTVEVVDRIIRDFSREVLPLAGREDFMAQLDFRCRALNGLFLGELPSDRYQRGPWNTPAQLGEYVLKALQIAGETRLAVRDAFMWYVDRLFDTIDVEGEFDEETLEPLIDQLRGALLGIDEASPLYSVGA